MRVKAFLRAYRDLTRFRALAPEERSLVFYAEDAASWSHFEPILRALTGRPGRRVCYLTSSETDPALARRDASVRAFYIGEGAVRTSCFSSLHAGVVVMTMPDLGTFHLKRSARASHYVYVHHSMISSHMAYRPGAFDRFDAVFCVGPHHVRETRALEALAGLPPKRLVEHGYGRLDSLLAHAARGAQRPPEPRRVLVAPSWGSRGLLETRGPELVEVLLGAGYLVTVRPHPMTARRRSDAIAALARRFGARADFALELDVGATGSLLAASVMISDWSGAALEYAFGLERPVLFVDGPRKVNNPDWERVGCEPLEVEIREHLGCIVPPERLADVPARIATLRTESGAFAARIRDARARWVFNVGASGAVGADYLVDIADRLRAGARP